MSQNMVVPVSPVPAISISLAPPQEPLAEPFSPFSATGPTTPTLQDSDSFRPSLLSPPPTLSPRFPRQLSPLRPYNAPISGKGLERERFEVMLQASRERNAAVGGKKSPDLRKEIAMKLHKSKQVERRALFLSKVQAPPSPTATLIPKTPPESPAIFHYSLPSPGLESPIAVFEMLALENPDRQAQTWVEQVDFRIPGQKHARATTVASAPKRKHLPSLDEITAHLSFQGHVSATAAKAGARVSARLPAFLQRGRSSPAKSAEESTAKPRRMLPIGVGRLQFPTRSNSPPTPPSPKMEIRCPSPRLFPPSPSSPVAPKLEITTTVVPRISFRSPTEFTESNLRAFVSTTSACPSRERTARDMLTRLRRRTLPPKSEPISLFAVDQDEERKLRRHSAPPELSQRDRVGFATPVLNLPGAF